MLTRGGPAGWPSWSSSLAANDVVPFVESPDEDATERDRPDAVVDLLETDRVVDEPVGDKEHALLEAERPSVGHPLQDEVPRIFERWQLARVGTGRRRV